MAHTVKTAGNEEKLGQDPAKDDLLILVDEADRKVGTASKERVHREGLLHRAFSVVLWREGADGPEVMLSRLRKGFAKPARRAGVIFPAR